MYVLINSGTTKPVLENVFVIERCNYDYIIITMRPLRYFYATRECSYSLNLKIQSKSIFAVIFIFNQILYRTSIFSPRHNLVSAIQIISEDIRLISLRKHSK